MKLICALMLALPLAAQSPLKLTPREREAFDYLRTTNQFQMELVGFAAAPSHGFIAFRIVAQSDDASNAFDELLWSGTPAAKIYGLIGIHHVDPVHFGDVAFKFRNNHDEVGYFAGCVMASMPIAELVRSIDGNLYANAFRTDADERVREAERTYDFKPPR